MPSIVGDLREPVERLELAGLCLSTVAGTWSPIAPRCTGGSTSLRRVRGLGPPVSEDTTFGIRELPYFTALISAKQVYVVLVVPEIKTYVPFPTERVISGENNEATVRRAGNRDAPA
jgi:hypothetical protein